MNHHAAAAPLETFNTYLVQVCRPAYAGRRNTNFKLVIIYLSDFRPSVLRVWRGAGERDAPYSTLGSYNVI